MVEERQISDNEQTKVERIIEQNLTHGNSVQIQERTNECKEALFNLDTAAENTLQLFSNLQSSISKEDAARGVIGLELYDQAATFLPTVLKKIQALTDLVQSTKKDSCSNAKMEE